MAKQVLNKTKKSDKDMVEGVKDQAAGDSRKAILDDLFQDFYSSRRQVYLFNFIRGIFFGLGTVLGGTLLVAIAVAILGQFVDWFPVLGDFIQGIINAMNRPVR